MNTLIKRNKKLLIGNAFLLPYLIFYLMFVIYPAIKTFIMSLYDWPILGQEVWTGLNNYSNMLADGKFWGSLWHTVYFVLLSTIPLVIIGLILALILNMSFPGKKLFRAIFFAPYLLNVSIISITWKWIFQSEFGLLNYYLEWFGLTRISWLANPDTAMIGIVIATIWWTVGFNMIIFLAGLQEIPNSIYEAAAIDGANLLKSFFYITIPLIKRTISLAIILQIIASFKIFGQVYAMTGGGPYGSTRVLVQYIYETAFRYFDMGYASAIAFTLFLIILIVSIVQIVISQRGEEK